MGEPLNVTPPIHAGLLCRTMFLLILFPLRVPPAKKDYEVKEESSVRL